MKIIVRIIAVCMALSLTAYYVLAQPSVVEQAQSAYNRGDFKAALPLFKKWAATPEVRRDPNKMKTAMAYIVNIEQRLTPPPATVPATGPAVMAAALAAATDPAMQQSDLLQQALSYAMSQQKNATDPATGADRVPHQPYVAGETLAMTIKQLGNFEFDPDKDSTVPDDVKAMDGAHLKLTGYMIPLTQAEKLTDFALVPSLVSCCFGQPPGVQHIITCHTPPKKGADFSVDEIVVEGTLHVNVKREDNYTNSIFELEVTRVQPKE